MPERSAAASRPARLAAALAASALSHAILLVLVAFAVIGPGGGLGVGSGPGLGVGSEGGPGMGRRGPRIFAVSPASGDAAARTKEEAASRLAAIRELDLPPSQPPALPPTEKPAHSGLRPARRRSLPARPLGTAGGLGHTLAKFAAVAGGFAGAGGGGGFGWSLGDSFAGYIGGLSHRGLDLALVIDATGSMKPVLAELKAYLGALVTTIQHLVPTARAAVVAYRDRGKRDRGSERGGDEFSVRWTDLSFEGRKIRSFLSSLRAEGGGDWEEAVRAGLAAALDELRWRPGAKKVIILVAGSPPHPEDREATLALARDFHARGGVLGAIDVSERLHRDYERQLHLSLYGTPPPRISPLPGFYREVQRALGRIAQAGGGDLLALGGREDLAHHLLTLAFGRRWEREVARIARGLQAAPGPGR